jgi:hypothetical protein
VPPGREVPRSASERPRALVLTVLARLGALGRGRFQPLRLYGPQRYDGIARRLAESPSKDPEVLD